MIYIMTPAGIETGGPELLHQLSFVLDAAGLPVRTVYYDVGSLKVIVAKTMPSYEKYQVKTESDASVIDSPQNTIVVAEQAFEFFDIFKTCKKIAWWLSVDGYLQALQVLHNVSEERLQTKEGKDWFHFTKREHILHLVQSEYARQFVKETFSIPDERIDYLSDYLNDIYLEGQVVDNEMKRNMVVFNPAKGLERLRPMIEKTQNEILWYPIVNMTPDQVRATLNLAKVYIDFGNHPGKDRIPREAAMSGCCILTGRRGSAAFFEDVSIPDQYKFRDTGEDNEAVIALIKDIFEDFSTHHAAFEDYRARIRLEKEQFVMDAVRIFCNLKI